MKTSKILLLIVFGTFFALQSYAQAEVTKNEDIYKFKYYEKIKKNKGILWETESSSTQTVISSSGNVLKTIYFQLQDDHPLMGLNLIISIRVRLEDGTLIADEKVEIKESGKFKVSLHLNGAGTNLPIGWQ